MRFSEAQWTAFDRAEVAKTFERFRRKNGTRWPSVCADASTAIRDALLADLAGTRLQDETIDDLFFLSFELGQAITREPAFKDAVDDLMRRNFPFEEIVSSIAGSRRRAKAIS